MENKIINKENNLNLFINQLRQYSQELYLLINPTKKEPKINESINYINSIIENDNEYNEILIESTYFYLLLHSFSDSFSIELNKKILKIIKNLTSKNNFQEILIEKNLLKILNILFCQNSLNKEVSEIMIEILKKNKHKKEIMKIIKENIFYFPDYQNLSLSFLDLIIQFLDEEELPFEEEIIEWINEISLIEEEEENTLIKIIEITFKMCKNKDYYLQLSSL